MMTTPPAWLAEYGGSSEAIDRFRSYVSIETVSRVYDAWKKVKSVPVPFSHWRWHSVAAPGCRQGSREWQDIHRQLRGYMDDGGVLVITGSARTGKTSLLEQLTPDSIIDNSRSGLEPGASVPSEQVPSGLFSIDETQAHDRRDIVRMIAEMMTAKRGFALVFQRPETFRDYQIGEYLAAHPVQFLNLSDR
jgi:hypothetical protein